MVSNNVTDVWNPKMSLQSPVAHCLHVVNILLIAPQAGQTLLFYNLIPPPCIPQHLHVLSHRRLRIDARVTLLFLSLCCLLVDRMQLLRDLHMV